MAHERNRNVANLDSYGYVGDRASAGRYSYDEARKIVASANVGLERAPNEAMVLDEPR